MAHGNRNNDLPKHTLREWESKSNKKNSISQWIINCMKHEKDIADKNKKNCELFHSKLK